MEIFLKILLILVTGVCAGFLNTVAGGGSLLTLPVLIFLGLSPAEANGTNRIAVLIQNASGIIGFRRKGVSDFGYSALLTLPALLGALIGAVIANKMGDDTFKRIFVGIMIAVLLLTLFDPTKKWQDGTENLSVPRKIIGMLVFFFRRHLRWLYSGRGRVPYHCSTDIDEWFRSGSHECNQAICGLFLHYHRTDCLH